MAEKPESEDLHALAASPVRLRKLRRGWQYLHVGWALLAAIVLAGAAGLFGSGPLSTSTLSTQGLALEYDRFVRRGTPFKLDVTMSVESGVAEASLAMPRNYFDELRISSVMPTPERVIARAETVTFVFLVEGAVPELAITIHGEPLQMGRLEGELASGNERLEFTQFVWP